MKRRLILYALFSLNIVQISFGQEYLTKVTSEPFGIVVRINQHVFHTTSHRKKKLYWDGKAIDSTGVGATSPFFFNDKLHWMNFDKLFFEMDLAGRLIKKNYTSNPEDQAYAFSKGFYVTERVYLDTLTKEERNAIIARNILDVALNVELYNRRIYQIDTRTGKKANLVVDLDSIRDGLDNHRLCQLFELPNNKQLITACCCDGGLESFHYFILDRKTKKVSENHQLIEGEPENGFYRVRFITNDASEKNTLVQYLRSKSKEKNGFFILGNDFKVVSNALDRIESNFGYAITKAEYGVNYQGEKITSYNIPSLLDNDERVLISYKFTLPLERSLYRVFNDQPVLPVDISQMDRYELTISKNLVYAKHNFKFIDAFYQAYFNMFDFYGVKKKKTSRLEKVDHLFSPMDRKNLDIIEKALTGK